MISAEDFEKVRGEICASGPASDGDNLLGMEIDFCAYLGNPAYVDEDPRLWRDMEVHRSQGGEWLITGHATGRSDRADVIARELTRVWEERLRYRYRAGHTVTSTPGYVRLRAVTQIGPGGLWVTAEVQVDVD
jgi:hypothetical protein